MATASRSGRSRQLAPLLILLLFTGSAAAPLPVEQAYREARAAVDRNDLLSAQSIAEKALAHTCADDDRDAVWALRVLRAEVIARRGDGASALEMLKPELPLRLRTSETAVYRLLALGYAVFTAAPEKVKAYFEQAHALAARHQPQMLPKTHMALANIATPEEAEAHLLAAAAIAEHNRDALQAATVKSVLQLRYMRAAQLTQAVEMGEDALATFESAGAFGRVATTSGNLGWAYLELGDRERAFELFRKAIDASTLAGLDRERVGWINQRGNTHFGEREFAQAETAYHEALSFGRQKNNDQLGDVLTNLSRTALETRRYGEAHRLNAEAIAERQRKDAAADLRSNRILQARIDTMTGNFPSAEKTLQAVLVETKKRKDTQWEAQARLAQLYVRMERPQLADQTFNDAIDTFRSARQAVADSELRLSYFGIARDLFDTYIDFLMRTRRVEEALTATEKSRAQTLLEQMNGTVQTYVDPRTIARQRGLTILSYWLGRERSYVWTVTPSAVTAAVLPPDDEVAALADAYRRALNGPRGSLELSGEQGRELYRVIVEPALHGTTPATPIAIIADGRLHELNFETLVTGRHPHYWIEDVVLSSASSLQWLARRGAERGRSHGLLLVGDPLPADPAYPPLHYAAEEIASVTRHFRERKILTRDDATPAAYRAADPGRYEYLHFVAHGVASRQRPLDSAIILGFDADRHYKLIARDIVDRPLAARLVTISSCHGAGERTYAGEGLVGLAWAFLRAGAGEVIAALWEVDDRATSGLMNDVYAGIQAGKDPATALRDAKLKLVRSPEVYRRPWYWAPFVLYSGS